MNPDQDFNVLSYLESVDAEHLTSRKSKKEKETWKTGINMNNLNLESESLRETRLAETCPSSKENGCYMEKIIRKEDSVISLQNNSGTSTDVTRWEHKKQYLSNPTELLPDGFQPLVLLVAGIRPVKVCSCVCVCAH